MIEPLSKKLPAGTTFAFLQCGAQACAVAGKNLADAVKAIGGTLKVINAGSTAATAQAATSSALALKPAVVVATGIEPSLYGGGLKTLSDAGIKVVTYTVAGDTKPFGITFNYLGSPTFELAGRLMADWVITNKGPQGYSVDRTFAGQVALHGRSALGRSRLGGCPPEPGGLGVTFFGWKLATRSR